LVVVVLLLHLVMLEQMVTIQYFQPLHLLVAVMVVEFEMLRIILVQQVAQVVVLGLVQVLQELLTKVMQVQPTAAEVAEAAVLVRLVTQMEYDKVEMEYQFL